MKTIPIQMVRYLSQNQRGDATLISVLVAGAVGAVILGSLMSGLKTSFQAQRHVALDEGRTSVARHLTESLNCVNTLANGYQLSSGAFGPVNTAAGTDCDPASPSRRLLVLRDRNNVPLTGPLQTGVGNFQYTGADGEWNLMAECDRINHSLVIRAARAGGVGGFGQDPLTKRTFDFTAGNSLFLFGSPTTPKICQSALGSGPVPCAAGTVMTGLDLNGNPICLSQGTSGYLSTWTPVAGGGSPIAPLGNSALFQGSFGNQFTNGTGITLGIDNLFPNSGNPGAIFYVDTSNPALANAVIFKGNATANFSVEGNKAFGATGQQNAASVNFVNAGTRDWWHQTLRDNGNLEWHYRAGSVSSFLQTAGGPGGNTLKMFQMMANGDFKIQGAFLAASDARLKKHIETLPAGALNRVSEIRGVTFQWKDDRSAAKHSGVIAQEVEKVAPELVSVDPKGMRSVDYGGMTGLLIEAIKDLKLQNEKLAAQMSMMQKQLEALR